MAGNRFAAKPACLRGEPCCIRRFGCLRFRGCRRTAVHVSRARSQLRARPNHLSVDSKGAANGRLRDGAQHDLMADLRNAMCRRADARPSTCDPACRHTNARPTGTCLPPRLAARPRRRGDRMTRREFLALLAGSAIAWSRDTLAQAPTKIYRLGSLDPARPLSANSPDAGILLGALAERGYTLGRNLAYDARASGGDNSKLPDLLNDFRASGVDVIVTIGYPATLAAQRAGVPTVVAAGVGDPVATGLVKSLAQPGGAVTGISDNATTLSTKRLSLLKELVPNLRRVAVLWNADDLG